MGYTNWDKWQPQNSGDKNECEPEDDCQPSCPNETLAECCDEDGNCFDGDDDWCCNGKFFCSYDGSKYAQAKGGVLCSGDGNIFYITKFMLKRDR